MQEEMDVIEKNQTWGLVDQLKTKEIIGVKLIYKMKFSVDRYILRNKARLVAKGYA